VNTIELENSGLFSAIDKAIHCNMGQEEVAVMEAEEVAEEQVDFIMEESNAGGK
jgi:hypothetical protein